MYKQTNTICKTEHIQLFQVIINCTIIMKTNSRFSWNAISDRIWCNKHLRHTTTENMITMGKVDTSDLILIIHRRNTPSARVPLLTARSVGSIYLFAPHSRQGTAQQVAEWGLIKATNPLFSTALEATFDKLQLIRTTLISKMIKTL